MRRVSLSGVTLTIAIMLLSTASVRTAAQQAPGPEHERLGFWVGDWSYVVGDGSGTMTAERLGDFFIQMTEVYTNPTGNTFEILGVLGYAPAEKVYTWHRYWSNGYSDAAKGWVHDDTWTFVFDEPVGEKARMTMVEDSPDVVVFRWERSIEGGPWEVTSEGRTTKVR